MCRIYIDVHNLNYLIVIIILHYSCVIILFHHFNFVIIAYHVCFTYGRFMPEINILYLNISYNALL